MNVTECCSDFVFCSEYGNTILLPITFLEGGPPFVTIGQPVASINSNTCCLRHPRILVEFSGVLNVTTTVSAISSLVFTLFRNCRGDDFREPLKTFTFYVSDITGDVTTSHALVFKYLSQDNCRECCCSYELEITSVSNLDLGTITYSINDGVISVLATDS